MLMMKLAREKPGQFRFASTGNGASTHLAGAAFTRMSGVDIEHIPYRGTGLVITDLVAGQITFLMDSIVSAQTHIKGGKVRALAQTGTKRVKAFPDVPTVAESGFPGFDAPAWWAVLAPAKTPPDIVTRLQREIAETLKTAEVGEVLANLGVAGYQAVIWTGMLAPAKTPPAIINLLQQEIARGISKPEVKELFMNAGVEVVASTADEFTTTIKSEMARLGKVIKDAGIRE